MKKLVFLIMVSLFSVAIIGAQHIDNLSYVSPFSEGLSAIQKDGKWAFINTDGELWLLILGKI